MLIHSVYFWLKPTLSENEKSFFFREVEILSEIKSVTHSYAGSPAKTPQRAVVEDSYDCGMIVLLEDISAHDQYQADPLHLAFIEKCAHMWEKVVIYDSQK
tara:strand:+ start:106 stop:408 length:303 start_codon:yes stop_codon:yes gene_type:complete